MKLSLIAMTFLAAAASAQNPISGDIKKIWMLASNNVVKAAEKMPEESYSFKASPDVRTFAQLIGHVADAEITFCAAAKGEKKSPAGAEKTKTTKADLIAALKDATAYCTSVADEMTDAKGTEAVKFFGGDMSRLGVLGFNNAHVMEHYGNIVTYMRIRGLVPPSSEPRK